MEEKTSKFSCLVIELRIKGRVSYYRKEHVWKRRWTDFSSFSGRKFWKSFREESRQKSMPGEEILEHTTPGSLGRIGNFNESSFER